MRMSWALALMLLCFATALSGCATTGGSTIPLTRLTCKDEPAVPDEPITDEKNGEYLRRMRGAWADCSSKLKWVRDFTAAK